MGARLYVGNLSFKTEGQGLRQFIEDGGREVREVHIVTDRETGRSRGFAFVELAKDEDLAPSIQQFDGAELDGRRLAVSEARPRRPRGEGDSRRGPADTARPMRSRPRREYSGPPDRNSESVPWSGGGEAAPWGEDDRGAGRGRAKKKKKKVTYQKRRDAWDDEDYGSEDSDEE